VSEVNVSLKLLHNSNKNLLQINAVPVRLKTECIFTAKCFSLANLFMLIIIFYKLCTV